MPPRSNRLIWIDCEMTGLEVATCKLLEIAAVVTEDSDQLTIVDQTESIVIHCDKETLDNMNQVVCAAARGQWTDEEEQTQHHLLSASRGHGAEDVEEAHRQGGV